MLNVNFPVWPGRSVWLDGETRSTPAYFCVANSRWTGPVANVPSRTNTIAVHVPPTGLRTSTCPWLPLPCGRVYAA